MKVEWVAYTRKNFNFPEVQKFPHRDPQEEVRASRGAVVVVFRPFPTCLLRHDHDHDRTPS